MKFYRFSKSVCDGNMGMKGNLGGKGANLAEMASMGLPVPAGFTIPTNYCIEYHEIENESEKYSFLETTTNLALEHMKWIEQEQGGPVLVSVRSGAPMSMPGMMDTILNVGITSDNMAEWGERIGQKAAADSYRRLIQMLGCTAYGIDHSDFEAMLELAKEKEEVAHDSDISLEALVELCGDYLEVFKAATDTEFPDTLEAQLRVSIGAVFNSWNNERAEIYRQQNCIPYNVGTAVNIQAMVFGNMNDHSGTGVLFSRNPSTGESGMFGEFLINAQGEDVVAGIRTPQPVHEMGAKNSETWDAIYSELVELCHTLELHYKDMMDIEFTVQDGELFVLQCRVGKRSAQAAIKIALDLHGAGAIDLSEVFKRITKEQFKMASRPMVDPNFSIKPDHMALPASPGVARGMAVFTSQAAEDVVKASNGKVRAILVTEETTPDDIGGMYASAGILTKTGGATSHAAVVARAMDKPCIVGCTDLDIAALKKKTPVMITIDGATGRVWVNVEVPVVEPMADEALSHLKTLSMKEMGLLHLIAKEEHPLTPTAMIHYKELAELEVEQVKTIKKNCTQLVVDFGVPTVPLWVAYLDNLFESPEDPVRVKAVDVLEHLGDLKGFTVAGATGLPVAYLTKFKKLGAQISAKAKNLKEYRDFEYPEVDDKFVNDMFGGDAELFEHFKDMLATMGIVKTKDTVRTAGHPDFAVFSVLAN